MFRLVLDNKYLAINYFLSTPVLRNNVSKAPLSLKSGEKKLIGLLGNFYVNLVKKADVYKKKPHYMRLIFFFSGEKLFWQKSDVIFLNYFLEVKHCNVLFICYNCFWGKLRSSFLDSTWNTR